MYAIGAHAERRHFSQEGKHHVSSCDYIIQNEKACMPDDNAKIRDIASVAVRHTTSYRPVRTRCTYGAAQLNAV